MRIHPLVPFAFKMIQRVQGFSEGPPPPCAKEVRCSCEFVKGAFGSLLPGVRFTAIYSKQDEIVDWRACIDPAKMSYEIHGQHLGLIVNLAAYRLLGQLLAHDSAGTWITSNETLQPPVEYANTDLVAAA